ncbi:hypothetical protein KA107_01485 [Candidatus Pacearchaeota archaeon]|nr:hypothetical protein [Candidatus Pacearchaeota archaeon]
MQKKIGLYAFLFLSLLVLSSVFTSISFASAAPGDSVGFDSNSKFSFVSALKLDERWALWTQGYDNVSNSQLGLLGETIKFLVLFIVVFIVFAALGAMDLPRNPVLRFVLAIIVGLLGTFMITTQELLTLLVSYGALSSTIVIALPLIVLLGLTVLFAQKANAAGLYASKILWAFFAVFIIIKGLILLMMFQYFYTEVTYNGTQILDVKAYPINDNASLHYALAPFLPTNRVNGTSEQQVDLDRLGRIMGKSDYGTAWSLILTGLIAFFVMVLGGKWIAAWLLHERELAAIERVGSNARIADAVDQTKADIASKGSGIRA